MAIDVSKLRHGRVRGRYFRENFAQAGIDLSQLLTHALRRRLPPKLTDAEREAEAKKWYEENKEAVDAYNELIKKHGLFSDGWRKF